MAQSVACHACQGTKAESLVTLPCGHTMHVKCVDCQACRGGSTSGVWPEYGRGVVGQPPLDTSRLTHFECLNAAVQYKSASDPCTGAASFKRT